MTHIVRVLSRRNRFRGVQVETYVIDQELLQHAIPGRERPRMGWSGPLAQLCCYILFHRGGGGRRGGCLRRGVGLAHPAGATPASHSHRGFRPLEHQPTGRHSGLHHRRRVRWQRPRRPERHLAPLRRRRVRGPLRRPVTRHHRRVGRERPGLRTGWEHRRGGEGAPRSPSHRASSSAPWPARLPFAPRLPPASRAVLVPQHRADRQPRSARAPDRPGRGGGERRVTTQRSAPRRSACCPKCDRWGQVVGRQGRRPVAGPGALEVADRPSSR